MANNAMVCWQGGVMTEESRSGGPKPRRSVTTVTGGGRPPLALHLIEIELHLLEIAPKKPLLFEHIHRKGVLLLG